MERVELELETPPEDEYQFVILKMKVSALSRVNIASDQNRKLAVWSWYERLADVETRKPSSLADELKNKKVDPTLAPPNLQTGFTHRKKAKINGLFGSRLFRIDWTRLLSFKGQATSCC